MRGTHNHWFTAISLLFEYDVPVIVPQIAAPRPGLTEFKEVGLAVDNTRFFEGNSIVYVWPEYPSASDRQGHS